MKTGRMEFYQDGVLRDQFSIRRAAQEKGRVRAKLSITS